MMKSKSFNQRINTAMIFVLLLAASSSVLPARAAPNPAPLQTDTLVRQIATSSDDVRQNVTDGNMGFADPGLPLGESSTSPQIIGLRFTNLTIPQGAAVSQAYLSFTALGDWSGATMFFINGHDVGDSPTFSGGDSPQDRQGDFTSAQVTWTPWDWSNGTVYQSPDLTNIVQEIVNRSDWTAGNALSLTIQDDGVLDGVLRQAVAWDSDPAQAAQLTIMFSEPAEGGLPFINIFDPSSYSIVALASLPDLVITNLTTTQAGYQAGTAWQAVVTVTNIGGTDAGHFAVIGKIGRIPEGEFSVSWAALHVFGEINSLTPGQSETITSPPFDFSDLPPDPIPTSYTSWEEGLPDRSQIILIAQADENIDFTGGFFFNEVEESDDDNNGRFTTFIYPNVPDDVAYDPNLDSDGDGHYPPQDCNDSDPTIYPGAPIIPEDSIDQDCSAGDESFNDENPRPPGWADPQDYPPGYGPDSDLDGDGYSFNDGDCNDFNPIIHPGQVEAPNNVDDDCDRFVDEGWTSADLDSLDLDGDGFSVNDGDCDDFYSSVNPDEQEIDDGLDNNCNGIIDEGIATPDWVIGVFRIERNHAACNYYNRPEDWFFGDICGLVFTLSVENQGEYMGPLATRQVFNLVRLTNLVNEYPVTNYEEGPVTVYIPYHEFSTASMVDLYACGPMSFIAYIPGGGLLGEENTANNWALASLDIDKTISDTGSDLDIVFGDHVSYGNVDIDYPYQLANSEFGLRVIPVGIAEGTCPPPELIDFTTRVRILHDGAVIYEQEKAASSSNFGPHRFFTQFASRPRNGDGIVIEMQLNSDGSVLEDTSNNDCVLTFSYDRAFYRRNDKLELENAQGCSYGGVGAVGGALSGASSNVGIVLAGLLVFGFLGGSLGWGLAIRLGVSSKAGLLVIALAGAAVAGGIGAGVGSGVSALISGSPLEPLPGQDLAPVQEDTLAANLPDLFQEIVGDGPVFCSRYVDSDASVVLDEQGGIEDILIGLHPGSANLPENSRYRITLWGEQGAQDTLTTQAQSVRLTSTRLAANLGEQFLWQVEVEAGASAGGDLYVRACLPEIHSFSLAGSIEVADAALDTQQEEVVKTDAILIPLNPIQEGASVFGGCDPDDPDCHAWARLEFVGGQAFIVFEVGVRQDHSGGENARLQTDLVLSRSDAPSLSISQEEVLSAIGPKIDTVQYGGQEFMAYALMLEVPEGVFGTFSVDGDVKLIGESGEELGQARVMAEEMDAGAPPPPPTPTFTPIIPTPTFTPAPPQDTSPPKVSGANASPNPALTTSPVTISATVSDLSGVASVMLYYHSGAGKYTLAGSMKTGGGNSYTLNIGTLTPAGSYDFRILATDSLGNATCGATTLPSCPGGTFVVNLP